jgi:hypothetical protein
MPVNDKGAIQVPYTNFLGLNTDLAPGDLPEGGSPDNQDCIYLPGEIDSRPCLHSLYPARGTTTITSIEPYVTADGTPLTLVLYSDGALFKEDVLNAPGVLVQIGSVAPGSYMMLSQLQNKAYMAFHDGLHGTDIPRQFDGTNFDRVSQDGPAAGPTIADLNTSVTITSVTLAAGAAISAVSSAASGAINIATFTTSTPHGLVVGQLFLVQGVTVANYNGVFAVVTVPSTTTLTMTYAGTTLGASSGGTVSAAVITVVTTTSHGMVAGDAFTFTGNAGTLDNNEAGNPIAWVVASVTNATTFIFALQNQFGILAGGQASTTGGANGTLLPGGFISIGAHSVVVLFRTRSGFVTAPSPPISWSPVGNKQAQATNVPIGPANVIQRILAFTGAGGSRYFYIPIDVAGGARATVLNDNTSTSLIVDFSDNTLFNAIPIDISGNNLFNLVTLGPCLSVFSFADRLFWGNEVNKVQAFLNMGLEGGILSGAPTVPLGWAVATVGGALVTNPVNFGDAWQITGDGTANAKGQLTQTAFQDINGIGIIEPSTNYRFRCWAKASANGLAGTLEAVLSSASTGFTSTASILVNTITTVGLWVQADFSVTTPAAIPSDLLLKIDEKNLPNLATVTIDELEIIFKDQPYRENDYRVSYVRNPESYDGDSGDLGPESDPNPLRCAGIIRKAMYIVTGDRLHVTRDNKQEPSTWQVDQVADQCGALSAMCIDGGTSWLTWASDQGLLICDGGAPDKLSQEIQPDWNAINVAAQHRIWIKNDQVTKRIYIGLPFGEFTAPSKIYVLDYRELDSEQQISSQGAVHVTLAGRMASSELSRKWTRWNVKAHCAAIIRRPGNVEEFVLGGGNGLPPGTGVSFGNAYFLDPAKLSDDDYGAMLPYYVSYGFVSHDQEQQFQVGSHRKLYTFISFFVTGVGTLQVTPYADVLTNAYPAGPQITLSTNQTFDWMYGMNVDASRVFLKFQPSPLPGPAGPGTDVQFKLTQLALDVMKHPISPVR